MEGEENAVGAPADGRRSERWESRPREVCGPDEATASGDVGSGKGMSGPDGWRPEMLAGRRMVRLFIEMGSHTQKVLLGGGKDGKIRF